MQETMDVVLSIHLVEDEVETVAVAELDLRDDHFEARGRARRNPVDPARPVIGEELAVARALADLESQINDSVQQKIDKFLVHTDG
jgi:hypothetical protein